MNISPNDDKIQKYLDELSEEYKTLLFKALLERTNSINEPLSMSELLRLDSEIKKPLFEDYRRQQKRKRTLIIGSLTYIFVGLFLLLAIEVFNSNLIGSATGNPMEIIQLMAIILTFSGFILGVYAFVFPILRTNSKGYRLSKVNNYTGFLEYQVIAKWRNIEAFANDISVDSGVNTTRSALDYLINMNFITKEEYSILKLFLKMRNDIVHNTQSKYSTEEIQEGINRIDQILERLQKIS